MNRTKLALLATVCGVAALFSLYALPWIGVNAGGETRFMSYFEIKMSSAFGGASPAEDGLNMAFGFMFHGILWPTVVMALATAGLMLRPLQRHTGESLALVGSLALSSVVFIILGYVFFFINLSKFNDENGGATAWYGINYLAPLTAVAFVALVTMHTMKTVGPALAVLHGGSYEVPVREEKRPAPMVHHAAPRAAPPARPMQVPSPRVVVESTHADPFEGERASTLERINDARRHAQGLAARAPGDAAMSAWLRDMETYLEDTATRTRAAKDRGTLTAVESDLQAHVFDHQ